MYIHLLKFFQRQFLAEPKGSYIVALFDSDQDGIADGLNAIGGEILARSQMGFLDGRSLRRVSSDSGQMDAHQHAENGLAVRQCHGPAHYQNLKKITFSVIFLFCNLSNLP